MTLQVPLSPELEAKLRRQAEAAGKDLATFVRDAVAELANQGNGTQPDKSSLAPENWSQEWHAWAESHKRLDHIADDDRNSIYAGRGE